MSKFPNLSFVGKLQTAYDLLNEALADDEPNLEEFAQQALVKMNLNLCALITMILENKRLQNDGSKEFKADYMGSEC